MSDHKLKTMIDAQQESPQETQHDVRAAVAEHTPGAIEQAVAAQQTAHQQERVQLPHQQQHGQPPHQQELHGVHQQERVQLPHQQHETQPIDGTLHAEGAHRASEQKHYNFSESVRCIKKVAEDLAPGHTGALIGGIIAFILGICFLVLPLHVSITLLIFVILGIAVGERFDGTRIIASALKRLFSRKF